MSVNMYIYIYKLIFLILLGYCTLFSSNSIRRCISILLTARISQFQINSLREHPLHTRFGGAWLAGQAEGELSLLQVIYISASLDSVFDKLSVRFMDEQLSEKGSVVNEKVDLDLGSKKHGENSRGSDNRVALEMAVVIRPVELENVRENRDLIHPDIVSKVLEDEVKVKGLNDYKSSSCVIDVKCGESSDVEWVCRICHLASDQSVETTDTTTNNERELIQLGCGCKDELGIAHSYCAEAWFKLKGNRLCEICGETAKNITGVADNRFMDQWNNRILSGYGIHSSERREGCWRGQPFCNFLMVCLVIAFVLPWFLRVKMF